MADCSMTDDCGDYCEYFIPLAQPKPMLIPDDDDSEVLYEVIPDPKPNAKLRWSDETTMMEIPPREIVDYDSEDSEDSYEIEIVDDDDGDADFSLEIVDGEVYYVFETEDDISVDDSMDSGSSSSEESSGIREPIQLPIEMMVAPQLDVSSDHPTVSDSEDEMEMDGDNRTIPSFHESVASFHIGALEEFEDEKNGQRGTNFAESSDTFPDFDIPKRVYSDANEKRGNLVALEERSVENSAAGNLSPNNSDHCPTSPRRTISFSPTASPVHSPLASPVTSPIASEKPVVGAMPASPLPSSESVKSILKACPPSPGVSTHSASTGKKKKKDKKKKEKKTFTKTYVRADTFDGEHSVIQWEKPAWAKEGPKLRSTGMDVKSGNLANPITFPKKYEWKHNVVEDDNGEQVEHTGMNAEDLAIKLKELSQKQKEKGMVKLPNLKSKFQKHLKVTLHGAKIREGGDIVKPITKATVDKDPSHHLNKLAKPEKLKKTDLGQKVKQGISPRSLKKNKIGWERPEWTKATLQHTESEAKTYEWEKPEWARKKENAELEEAQHSTTHNSPIRKTYEWQKPEWAQRGKNKSAPTNLEKPITFPRGKGDGTNAEAKPDEILRSTDKGAKVREGENLAKPITTLPELAKGE